VTLAEGDLRRRVLTIGGSSRIETHEDRRSADCSRANGVPNIRPRRLVTLAMASASNAPRTPRAPRTDGVFLFAALPFATARPLRTLDRVQRMAQQSAWTLSGQHTGLTGLTNLPLTERGERNAHRLGERLKALTFARAFTSPLRRAFRMCEPRRVRRGDRALRARAR
jgi:hypothetical protein